MHHIFIHATGRGRLTIDSVDYDKALFLLERTSAQFNLLCHAWCYLPTHTHLLVTSADGNLSKAMQWLGTCTAQWLNRRHGASGHAFKCRFESRLVDSEKYLFELARYLPLNPVRAGLCDSPAQWGWSSYAATVGLRPRPWFLNPEAFLDEFTSVEAYVLWVRDGVDETFLDDAGRPRPPPPPIPLAELLRDPSDAALARAHFDHGFTQASIARHLGIGKSHVSRRIARGRQD
jgi:putative transposase